MHKGFFLNQVAGVAGVAQLELGLLEAGIGLEDKLVGWQVQLGLPQRMQAEG